MRLWVLSWAARGWEPRILLQHETIEGLFVRPTVINFSERAPRKKPASLYVTCFGIQPDWREHSLVDFPDAMTDEDILACERPLDL